MLNPFAPRYALTACAGALFMFSVSGAMADKTQYPLTIKNCGHTLTFKKAPENIVSVGQNSTEILYLLGLADKVSGTALWISPVLEEFTEVNKKIERLADNDPSFESVVSKKPDLVATQYQWQIGPVGVVGTVEQFTELDIPVYTSPSDCEGKDNTEGGDGTRNTQFTMDLVYKEIEELSQIFDVQDKGKKVVAGLKAREEAAKKKVSSLQGNVSGVFWFSSADLELDPYVAGKFGPSNYIMQTLGMKNVIDSADEWPTVGWETIAKADPTVIVLGKMSRRRFPADDWEVKMDFLKNDAVTKLMPAVEKDRLVVIEVQTMNAGIRTVNGIEEIAEALLKFGLAK